MCDGICFEDLTDDFFILNQPDSYITHHCEMIFREHHFHPMSFCEIEDVKTARSMVINGKGIAFLPSSIHEGNDYRAFSLDPPAKFYIVIAYHKNSIPSKASSELIERIKECRLI